MTEVVLFIYLLGVIVSMIVWSIRQFKGDASLVETMYCPIVFLSSWIYVFEILKKNKQNVRS
jgi:tryptophan-rich sensory protein